jgi:short-subunit dehydrogenase
MLRLRGKSALVTGASSGIGRAFAEELAARGMNLVLVARSCGPLEQLATELTQRAGVRVEPIPGDLCRPDEVERVYRSACARGLAPDVLINNAGVGSYGPFETLSLDVERNQILLNTVAVAELTRLCLPAMVSRGEGAVINVASAAAFQPLPYMAVYAATKAFVLSFSEALWAQYRGSGVRVLALCPGPVDTPFFDKLGAEEALTGPQVSPQSVVAAGLSALEKGRCYVIPGWRSYLIAHVPSRLLPRSLVARIAHRVLRPRRGDSLQGKSV